MSDANWGPQDQLSNKLSNPVSLPLFKSRSLSSFVLWLSHPLHWVSKRQTITARSTAEAEIYATDECTKAILQVRHLLNDLNLFSTYAPSTTSIYNDNVAYIKHDY